MKHLTPFGIYALAAVIAVGCVADAAPTSPPSGTGATAVAPTLATTEPTPDDPYPQYVLTNGLRQSPGFALVFDPNDPPSQPAWLDSVPQGLLWYAPRRAFRAGAVGPASEFGFASTAFGMSRASGGLSFASGQSRATGLASTAFGEGNASGGWSIAGGYLTEASGISAIALGRSSRATGHHSIALGRCVENDGPGTFAYASTAFGDCNLFVVPNTVVNAFLVRASGGVVFYTNGNRTTGVQLTSGSSTWTPIGVTTPTATDSLRAKVDSLEARIAALERAVYKRRLPP
jgi:trimeric autotransporter adhesin